MSDWYRPDGSGPLTFDQFMDENHDFAWDTPIMVTRVRGLLVETRFTGQDAAAGSGVALSVPLIYVTTVRDRVGELANLWYSSHEWSARREHERIVRRIKSERPRNLGLLSFGITAAVAAALTVLYGLWLLITVL